MPNENKLSRELAMDGIRRVIYSSFLVLGLIGVSSYSLNMKNQNYKVQKSIDEVKEGVNICFARLQQTYTSVYISPNLSYLAVDFLKMTESCFAQALAVAIDARIENSTEVEKLINRLGNYVRLFHAGVKNKSLFSKGKSDFTVANSRFVKLEETRDQILTELDSISTLSYKHDQQFNYFLYALMAGSFLGIFSIIYFHRGVSLRLKRCRQQIISSLEATEENTPDISQAFYKAMKFLQIPIPRSLEVTNILPPNQELPVKTIIEEEVVSPTQVEKKVSEKDVKIEQLVQGKSVHPDEEPLVVTLGDILGEILLEYSPDILSKSISTKFNEFEEVAINRNSRRLYHLMKFIFGMLVKSDFQGTPFIHLFVEKKTSPVIKIKTNSIFSKFENYTSKSLFRSATESFSDEFDLSIEEGNDGNNLIEIKQKKRLVSVFRGTKKQFLSGEKSMI